MPDDDASSGGNIKRMFRAILRNLQAAVAHIDNLLMYAFDLIAEDNGVFFVGLWINLWVEVAQHSRTMTLFYAKHDETASF